GILMKSDGSQTFFSAEKTGAGMATIEIDRIGAEAGISRGGALAALRFIAGALGRTTITFATVVAESSQGKPITVHTVPAEITVAK
ncbi:MAG: hypothetical protein ACE5HU_10790, partial [Acidobacteriota bacterium]